MAAIEEAQRLDEKVRIAYWLGVAILRGSISVVSGPQEFQELDQNSRLFLPRPSTIKVIRPSGRKALNRACQQASVAIRRVGRRLDEGPSSIVFRRYLPSRGQNVVVTLAVGYIKGCPNRVEVDRKRIASRFAQLILPELPPMAIEFSCSSCQKNYRVKDELAGKMADCSACGAKIRIPELVSAASESDLNLKSDFNLNSLNNLIEDELPTEQSATLTPAVTTTCESCGAPINLDAVVCVACGFDKRSGDTLETESEAEIEAGEARTPADRLKRGGGFSFLGAILGAAVWFGLAWSLEIGVQVGYPALFVGALAGLGMGRFHGEGAGIMAGLVASVMALAGIFAAKALIYDNFRATFVEGSNEGKSLEELGAGTIQMDSFFSAFQWYDLLLIPIAMAMAFALAGGNEPTESKVA